MSSHREAPAISADPVADNTDLYAFVGPAGKVTILSNFIPLQEPAGGPNFFLFGDDVLYEIMIDNNGDGIEDITYQFRFKTETVDSPFGPSFLFNIGAVDSLSSANLLVRQTYSVSRVAGQRRTGAATVLATGIPTPPPNIGPDSTPSYAALAAAAVTDLGGGRKVFAGQRAEGFYVNLGQIFNLLQIGSGVDYTSGFNVHTIGIQVPIEELTAGSAVIGVWTSASRQKATVRDASGHPVHNAGPWVQVSRLGNPLINEVIIPRKKKDLWNASEPKDDQQFLPYYLAPELATLLNVVLGLSPPAPTSNRTDLEAVLLRGLPDLNFTGATRADMLRLNTAIPPAASPNRLGVLAGDLAGYPNGRRVGDDVTDIELSAVRGVTAGVGSLIGDLVNANDESFLAEFPYLGTPHSGTAHVHTHAPPP